MAARLHAALTRVPSLCRREEHPAHHGEGGEGAPPGAAACLQSPAARLRQPCTPHAAVLARGPQRAAHLPG